MNGIGLCAFVLIPFILLTSKPSTIMLNKDQAQSVQAAYDAYQNLKTYCTQHKLDINTILTVDQKKQMQTGMQFLKTWMPKVKEVAMDIPKPTFVEALIQWKSNMQKVLNDFAQTYKDVNINPAIFKDNLGTSSLPIINMIYSDWETALANLNNPTTADTLLKALQNGKNLDAISAKNAKGLEKHYNKYKKTYKGINDGLFISQSLPTQKEIEDAIKASIDPKDADHPDKKKEAHEQDSIAQVEEKAKRKKFDEDFETWQKEMIAELGQTDTIADDSLVSYTKVENNLKDAFATASKGTESIIIYLNREVETNVKSKKGVRVFDLKKMLGQSIAQITKAIDLDVLYKDWKTIKNGFIFPVHTSFRTALIRSKLDVSYDIFKAKVGEIAVNDNSNIIDTIANNKKWEKTDDKREVSFHKDRLKAEFEIAFNQTTHNIKTNGFVYDALNKGLDAAKGDKIPLDEVKAIWKSTLDKVVSEQSNQEASIYKKDWLPNVPAWQLETIVNNIPRHFPNEGIITAVLEAAQVHSTEKAKPKKSELQKVDRQDAVVFEGGIAWNNVPSLGRVALSEIAQETLIDKYFSDNPETLTPEEREAQKELEEKLKELNINILSGSDFLEIPIESSDIKLDIPLVLKEKYSSNGAKYVVAKPNLDLAKLSPAKGNGYYSIEQNEIYTKTEEPRERIIAKSDTVAGSTSQVVVVDITITEPAISNNIGMLAGTEVNRNATVHTFTLEFLLTCGVDIKHSNPLGSTISAKLSFIRSTDTQNIVKTIRGVSNEPKITVYK